MIYLFEAKGGVEAGRATGKRENSASFCERVKSVKEEQAGDD